MPQKLRSYVYAKYVCPYSSYMRDNVTDKQNYHDVYKKNGFIGPIPSANVIFKKGKTNNKNKKNWNHVPQVLY